MMMCPARPHNGCLLTIAPDLCSHVGIPRRSGTRGLDQIGRQRLFGRLQDTPLKIEYPAVRHANQNAEQSDGFTRSCDR